MRRVLVTGGAGFIGSHLSEALSALGDRVLVVDNFSTGRKANLANVPSVEIVEADVADAAAMQEVTNSFKPDVLVHAAASYRNPDDWEADISTNILGTARVVQAAAQARVRRLIYFQTALCYGLHPAERPIRRSHPLMPASSYAISKVAAERYVELSGLDYVSFRIPNAYGPRGVAGPLASFVRNLTGGLACQVVDSRRDFVFIDDLIEIVLMAIAGKGATGWYHVASGTEYTIAELFRMTIAAMGMDPHTPRRDVPLPPDDVYANLLDLSLTQEVFGWEAKTPLEAGVQRTVRYYLTHGIGQAYSHLRSFGD
ncbi:MAG: UDP-glucose 4-epimerase [Thermoanaerobaculia bacterium]|jgi:UDP-glucose 4-epimerase|nr:UDP-glucose 4-epimerase [Thermoanaerobaculia bacterium]